jgi:hypothetical protein
MMLATLALYSHLLFSSIFFIINIIIIIVLLFVRYLLQIYWKLEVT